MLGVYFISYPTAWVRVLLPILFFFWTFDLPAVLVLAFWFVSQFFSGITAITQIEARVKTLYTRPRKKNRVPQTFSLHYFAGSLSTASWIISEPW